MEIIHNEKTKQLIITIDVSESALRNAPRSKTGKSNIVASTSGFTTVGPVKLSLNCIK